MKFINKENFKNLVEKLSINYDIFYPQKMEEQWVWAKWGPGKEFFLEGHRAVLPIKYFFYSPQENLVEKKKKPAIIFGARGCDIRGLNLLKKIYLEEPQDPYFRGDILIFSADCTSFHSNCFCTLLGDKPWPEGDFDLNFSPFEEGVLVEIGSGRGGKISQNHSDFFKEAKDFQEKEVKLRRLEIAEKLKKHNEDKILNLEELKEKIKENKSIFEEYGKSCVSCSACTNICPACFCFFLSEGDENKIRYMDSCQLKGYARVAGGANPRKELIQRFKNRFNCKFIYRPEMQGLKGCTGCGRCIDACQGKINFKEVILKVNSG